MDGAVVGVVDHELILVGVAEEDVGDDVWAVAVDDLVEEIGWIGNGVGPVPACEDVAQDPHTLASVLGGLELLDEEGDVSAVVGVGGVDVIEEIGAVPEIGVECDDSELGVGWVIDTICGIVHSCFRGGCRCDPVVLLPECGDMVIIPALLLA